VQLARNAGAKVIGLSSYANYKWLTDHGVIPVTYGDGVEDRIRAASGGFPLPAGGVRPVPRPIPPKLIESSCAPTPFVNRGLLVSITEPRSRPRYQWLSAPKESTTRLALGPRVSQRSTNFPRLAGGLDVWEWKPPGRRRFPGDVSGCHLMSCSGEKT